MDTVAANRFLLTAAMTRYWHDPQLDRPELAGDVERIAGLFTREFGYVHLPLPDSPTHAHLRDGLRKFCKAPERGRDDFVAVYVACHGAILPPDEFVLLPSDVDPGDLVPRAVRPQELVDWLLRETNVRRLLLMLDTCYSGQGGQDAARAAVRWVNQPGAADRPGVVLVTATHPWQEAAPGVFSRAFERAVGHLATGGHAQEDLPLDAVVEVINADREKPASQTVTCHVLGMTGRPPPFLPNPRYRPRLIDADLLEQERARHAEQREAHLRDRFVPATRWFTGRHAALTDLAAWLNNPSAAPRALVVTGDAGSGKTALLGLLAILSDPDRAPAVPRDGLPEAFAISGSPIAEAIYAGTMTTGQVRDRIAAAAGVRAETTQELIDGLSRRDVGPLVVLVDALDEAADPGGLIRGLLSPLMTQCAGTVRLLLGTRSHLLTAKLLGTPDVGRYLLVDLDSGRYADPASIRAYVRRILLAEDPLDSAYRPAGLYRTAPADVVHDVTEAIGQAAGASFLVARITATTEATAAALPSPGDPAWRAALPRRAGPAMRRDLRLRLGGEANRAERLLLPLAYAQGAGLPWENIWPRLAEALSPGHEYGNDDLIWLRRTAGSYAVEGHADDRSAYRLYHQALTEHLLDGRDQHADQQAITDALITLVPPRAGGGRDWAAAHPYTRTHLATHAVQAGCIDGLLTEPAYLLTAARPQLLASLGAARSLRGRSAADAYRRAAPHLRAAPARQHASYLQLAARCGRAPGLADAFESCRPHGTWSARWASWRPETPHRTFTGRTGPPVWSVAVGELDGRPVVVAGSNHGTVRVWDLASGARVGGPFTGHTEWVSSVAVGELEGRPVVVSGSGDGTVRVWELASGARVGDLFTGHTGPVRAVAVGELEGRPVIVSGGDDGTVRVWDLASGARVGGPFTGHTGWVIPRTSSGPAGRSSSSPAEVGCQEVQAPHGPLIGSKEKGSAREVASGSGAPTEWGQEMLELAGWSLFDLVGRGQEHHGQTGWVFALAVGELEGRPVVVSGGGDGTVRVWDLASGARVGDPFTGHTGRVFAVAVGELDGRPVVVSGGDDGTVRVWDLATAAPVGNPFTGHTGRVHAVAVGELEGRPVVVSGGDGTVRVWDLASGTPVGDPFTGHTVGVRAVAVGELEGRPVVVSGGEDGTVRVWDLASGPRVGDPFGHTNGVSSVAVGELEGRPVVVSGGGYGDGTMRVWDLASGARLGGPFGHTGGVSSVAVGELDGRPVVVSGCGFGDGTVRVWDLASKAPVGDPFTGHTRPVRAVAIGELEGRPVVVSGGDNGTVRVWDLASGAPVGDPFDHTGGAFAVAVGELEGRPVVVSGGGDRTVRVWDLASGAPVGAPFTGHTGWVSSVAVGELDGRPVVVSGCGYGDSTVRVWDLASGVPVGDPFTGHTGWVSSVAVGELEGRPVVVSGGGDGTVRVWDLASRAPVGRPFTGHTGSVSSVAVGELDGRPVVVSGGGYGDGTVRVWDLASGAPVGDPFTGHTGSVSSVAVGELEGRPVVVSGSYDGTVRVWDLASGVPVGDPFTGHTGWVFAVAVGELEGRPVVVSGDNDTVRVWDLVSGAPVGDPFTGHTERVSSVALGELEGRPVVVSGSYDGTVRVWDLASGAPVGRPLTGHTGSVSSVAVGELGGRPVVVSGGYDGTVRVWEPAKRRAIRHLRAIHVSGPTSVTERHRS